MTVPVWYMADVESGQIVNAVSCRSRALAERTLAAMVYRGRLRLIAEAEADPVAVADYERVERELAGG